MVQPIRNIVVVGGGTAGWLTASVIASRHQGRIKNGTFSVTLIESPDIRIVGVGEATWPSMRTTLQKVGVSETRILPQLRRLLQTGREIRPLGYRPRRRRLLSSADAAAGLRGCESRAPLDTRQAGAQLQRRRLPQEGLCEDGLAPKMITTPETRPSPTTPIISTRERWAVPAKALRREAGRPPSARQRDRRKSRAKRRHQEPRYARGRRHPGDLFVDCTGFSAFLIGKTLGVGFKDCNDVLFCDTALAVNVPYATPDAPVSSHTIKTAQSAGWIWDIALATRRGVGHTYSSRHITDEEAEQELRR